MIRIGLEGWYKCVAVYPDGSEVVLRDWMQNLILDNGIDNFFTTGLWNRYCSAGTVGTDPTPEQTTLLGYVASSSITPTRSRTYYHAEPYYGGTLYEYTFAVGAVSFVAELGIGPANDGTSLTSRIAIKDENGYPAPLTVPASAYLRVLYELREYPPLEDVTFPFSYSGTDYVATIRAAFVDNVWPDNNGSPRAWNPLYANSTVLIHNSLVASCKLFNGLTELADIFNGPTSAQATINSNTIVPSPYAAGSFFRDFTIPFPSGGTLPDVGCVLVESSIGCWQIGFDPPIARLTSEPFKITVRLGVGRYVFNGPQREQPVEYATAALSVISASLTTSAVRENMAVAATLTGGSAIVLPVQLLELNMMTSSGTLTGGTIT